MAKTIKIFGEKLALNAEIYTIGWFSAHADRDELIDWLNTFRKKPTRVFVVHGEEKTAMYFAETVKNQLRLKLMTSVLLLQ
jgi:metallo-beta-lactamase family protein